jgi:heme oxygenase
MLATTIKEATKTAHQDVEKKVVLRIKAIKDQAGYIDLLKHFYAYFSAVEYAIAPFLNEQLLPDLSSRRTAAHISADIKSLGGATENLPAASAPQITNVAQAMGALYVLEGSVMGGPYIVQMLRKAGLDKGFSFFSGYGDNSRQKWEAFTSVLNSFAKSEEDKLQAVKSAEETFSSFGAVFGN